MSEFRTACFAKACVCQGGSYPGIVGICHPHCQVTCYIVSPNYLLEISCDCSHFGRAQAAQELEQPLGRKRVHSPVSANNMAPG